MTKPPRSAIKATILRSITSMFERTSSRELQVTALFNFYSLLLSHNAKNKRRPDRGVRWTAARPGTNLIDLLNVVTPFAMLTHPIVLKPWHAVRHPNMGLRLQTGIIVQSGYPNNYVWLC